MQPTHYAKYYYAVLGKLMLGYTEEDLLNMIYGIETVTLTINADENPAIYNYLVTASDFLKGLDSEGYFV